MKIIELYAGADTMPYGIIGLDKKNTLIIKGLDADFYSDWLSGFIDDEEGIEREAKDGEAFLKAVQYQLLKNVYDGELIIKGPIEVDMFPELKELS